MKRHVTKPKMSAPLGTQEIQKEHHIRSELCMTRAKYREGRELKAVKVYTINSESKYLLIQGVPTLGAEQELLRASTTFGPVTEHKVLKEYPAEAFTEVYLIKYQKIQSARIAKRKLDDFSFFGGVLHVCYAPEYESTDETREKLQDRRKAVAKRLRELDAEKPKRKQTKDTETSSEDANDASAVDERPQTNTVDSTLDATVDRNTIQTNNINFGTGANDQYPPPYAPYIPGPPTLPPPSLPPPPRPLPPWLQYPAPRPSFDHAAVPSAHATLPPWLQRLPAPWQRPPQQMHPPQRSQNLRSSAQQQSGPSTSKLHDEIVGKSKMPVVGLPPPVEGHFVPRNVQKQLPKDGIKHGSLKSGSAKQSEVIIRDYKIKGPKPNFLPRQISRKVDILAKRSNPSKDEFRRTVKDAVNESLRRNAFILDDMKGPRLPEEEESKRKTFQESETGSVSLDNTVQEIRHRVNQFSTSINPPQTKRQKTS